MTKRMQTILGPGSVAVVTGAAKGIGAALARALAARGMKLALFDRDISALEAFRATLSADILSVCGDVSCVNDLRRLREQTLSRFGSVQILVNNAGITQRSGPFDGPENWRNTIDTNFTALLAAQHLFVPAMIASEGPAAILNLGSKEGITTPPGNAAYSVAKAAVKVLTEQAEHELRNATGGRVSAHLMVPGYTWTPMNFPDMKEASEKPAAPWSATELVEYVIGRLLDEDFYIICPDNEVTSKMDAKRIRWAADDMVLNRRALSRWHPDYKAEFDAWMAD